MQTEIVEYPHDGVTCRGIRIWDGDATHAAPRPGILHVPDARGAGLRPRHHIERMVAQGHAVFVADLYGEGFCSDDFALLMPRMAALRADRAQWRGRARAALLALASWSIVDGSRLGAMGYCFGGTTVIELALSGAGLVAAVSFHGGLDDLALGDAAQIKARMLICTGAADPLVPAARVLALQQAFAAGGVADWQITTFGNTKHSFTNPHAPDDERMGYHALSDARALASATGWFSTAFA